MPKGSNPNSRKNLEKGAPYRFKAGDRQGKSEAGKLGTKKQAEARTFAEEIRIALETEITNGKGEKVKIRKGIITALIKKALTGDYRTFESIRDTVGEKPTEKVEQLVVTPEVDFEKLKALRKALQDDKDDEGDD